jgi:phage N-6-adenine-methyltransferase
MRVLNRYADMLRNEESTPDDNATPWSIVKQLHSEFNITLDVAANDNNARCENYYTEEENSLIQDWSGHTVFCCPPSNTKNICAFVKKSYEESLKGTVVVMLLPSRLTDGIPFREYLIKGQIRFISGRIKFKREGKEDENCPFGSMVVIFNNRLRPKISVVRAANLSRPVNIEPILINTFTNAIYLFTDTKQVVDYLAGWLPIEEDKLIDHILTESPKLIGVFKVYSKDRNDEIMAMLEE